MIWVLNAFAGPSFGPLDEPNPYGPATGVYLPELTWMQARDALNAGKTTVLVPTGGIEQNGPSLVLGKHDLIVRALSERVALAIGDALVAPVVSFVPEGDLLAPSGHMYYTGTLSVRSSTFAALLEDTARSYRDHGFNTIVFLGDSQGNQAVQEQVADRLDLRWPGTRVLSLEAFYDPEDDAEFLSEHGYTWKDGVRHDSPASKLQLLALEPSAVLDPQLPAGLPQGDEAIALGRSLVDHRVQRSVQALQDAKNHPPSSWRRLITWLGTPVLHLFHPGQRIWVPYLISALLLAGIVELYRQGRAWSLPTLFQALFPRRLWGSRDAFNDLTYTLFGGMLLYSASVSAFSGLYNSVRTFASDLLHLIPSPHLPEHPLLLISTTVVLALVADFTLFLGHWLQHRVPVLWTFHQVHHSARDLNPLTIYRMHPVDILLYGLISPVLMGITAALLGWLFAGPYGFLHIMGLNVITLGFYFAGFNLRHTHYWVSFGPLEHLFVSPAMHQIHHSEDPRHHSKNLGVVFSFWDRWFGTLYKPNQREELRFGIGEDTERFRTAWDFVIEPFRQVFNPR